MIVLFSVASAKIVVVVEGPDFAGHFDIAKWVAGSQEYFQNYSRPRSSLAAQRALLLSCNCYRVERQILASAAADFEVTFDPTRHHRRSPQIVAIRLIESCDLCVWVEVRSP
jgi:hypothetical protein